MTSFRPSGDQGFRRLATVGAISSAVAFVAIFVGLLTAYLPPSVMAKAAALLAVVVVLTAALFTPAAKKVPEARIVVLLSVFVAVSAVFPSYASLRLRPLPDIGVLRVCYFALAGTWIFWAVSSPALRRTVLGRLRRSLPFIVLFGAFIACQFFAALYGDEKAISLQTFFKQWVPAVLLFLIALSLTDPAAKLNKLLVVMVFATVITLLEGGIEYARKANLFLAFVPDDRVDAQAFDWILLDKSRGGAYRVAAAFTHPLALAEYLVFCLPLFFHLLLHAKRGWVRVAALLVIVGLAPGLYMTHTRSALILGALSVALYVASACIRFIRVPGSFPRAVFSSYVLVAIALVVVSAGPLVASLASGRSVEEAGSSFARVVMLSKGLYHVSKEPLLGYGPGLAALIIGPMQVGAPLTIDNYYLSVALESGVPSLIFFAGACGVLIVWCASGALQSNNSNAWLFLAIGVSLLAFLVQRGVLSLTSNFDLVAIFIGFVCAMRADQLIALGQAGVGRLKKRRPSLTGLVDPTAVELAPVSTRSRRATGMKV